MLWTTCWAHRCHGMARPTCLCLRHLGISLATAWKVLCRPSQPPSLCRWNTLLVWNRRDRRRCRWARPSSAFLCRAMRLGRRRFTRRTNERPRRTGRFRTSRDRRCGRPCTHRRRRLLLSIRWAMGPRLLCCRRRRTMRQRRSTPKSRWRSSWATTSRGRICRPLRRRVMRGRMCWMRRCSRRRSSTRTWRSACGR